MKYACRIFWSDEDDGFIAECPHVWGCVSAWGRTRADALRELEKLMEFVIKNYPESLKVR